MGKLTKEQIAEYAEAIEELENLQSEITAQMENMKNIIGFGFPVSEEEYPLYTEDIAVLFRNIKCNCEEFISAYNYYIGKRLPLPNSDELAESEFVYEDSFEEVKADYENAQKTMAKHYALEKAMLEKQ